MSVQTELDRINAAVTSQSTLLTNLKALLLEKGAANGIFTADQLPSFLHRLEFQQFSLVTAGNSCETTYALGASSTDYDVDCPNFAICWTDDAVSGTNEVIQFVYWTDREAPYEKVSYIYANEYGPFVSYARCVYPINYAYFTGGTTSDTGCATIKLYTPPDLATSTRPETNFTFAANVTYNLIIGKFKDKYNE